MFLQFPLAVLLPQLVLVWAFPISLATTFGITGLFSFPPGTKMFQFPGFSPHKLCIGLWVTALFNAAGFPHSDTPGSLSVYDSPRRFAVFCVLLLLYMPRHPPYALFRLITTYLAYLCFYENCILRFTLRIDFVLIFSFLQLLRKTYLSFFCYSVFKEHRLAGLLSDLCELSVLSYPLAKIPQNRTGIRLIS